MPNTINSSSELMQNYVQAEIMSPQSKFEALQTSAGLSLLFSIGTDNTFYVTEETQGISANGWQKHDLSTAQISKDFAGQAGVYCKTFEAAQNNIDGTIGIAMVISNGKNDHLYLCLGNSNTDSSWLNNPQWTSYPYDATSPSPARASLQIVNVFISETTQGQYILVDIVRDPASANLLVSRYYIDPAQSNGTKWNVHSLTIDLQTSAYQSTLGRQAGQSIDGIYTIGNVDGQPQFIYQPLYNIWNQTEPANPSRLSLPQQLQPDSIAAHRNSDESTDLYCTANGALYYFASTNQQDQATGTLLFNHSLFTGVTHLFAASNQNQTFLWGLNQANQVFYTSCPSARISDGAAWRTPLPILTNVDLISPYLNVVDGGNSFFSVGGNLLHKMIKSPATGLWNRQQITLPAPNVQSPAKPFSSYTTRIQLVDEKNIPVANANLMLSTATRATFYINNLYYVLDTNPIPVATDAQGLITIIETVNDISGTQLQVQEENGPTTTINPMEKPFLKATQLNTVSSLQNAVVTNADGTTYPLVPSGNTPDDLQAAALSLGNLAQAYADLSSKPSIRSSANSTWPRPIALSDAIETDIGDLFSWLESGIDSIIQIIKDDAFAVWHFVVQIGETIYHAVLDVIEKVIGALKWLFNAILTLIEDLIKFLEFLFEWKEITRTKEVLQNLMTSLLHYEVNQIGVFRQEIDAVIQQVIAQVNGWSGVGDWSGLGSAATSLVSASSNPTIGLSSPGTLLSYHFQNNINNLVLSNSSLPGPTQSTIDQLLQTLQNHGSVFDTAIGQLQAFSNGMMNVALADMLTALTELLNHTLLANVAEVVDALFALVQELAQNLFSILETPVQIPVVSDILNQFGVPSISLIDLFCWIVAVPVTVAYKIAEGTEPFPDNATTSYLINTTDFTALISAFNGNASTKATSLSVGSPSMTSAPNDTQNTIFAALHSASGFLTFVSAFVTSAEAAEENQDNGFSIPSAVLGALAAITDGAADYLAPQDAIQDATVKYFNIDIKVVTLVAKIVFSGKAQEFLSASTSSMNFLKVDDGRSTGAVVNVILIIPALFCTCWHFYELSKDSSGAERSNAILEETSNLTSYISRVSYLVAITVENPKAKEMALLTLGASNLCTGGLQIAEVGVGFS